MADQNPRNNQRFNRLLATFCEQFNAAFINVQLWICCLFQQEELPAGIFPHAAFAFTIIAILGFLQVKYQGKDKTPFDSHPRTIAVANTSLLIYCLAYGIEQRLSSNRRCQIPRSVSNAIRWCVLLTGPLSLAATASFLFPDSVRPVLFVIYIIGSAGEILYRIYGRFTITGERSEPPYGWRGIQLLMTRIWQFINRCFTERRQRQRLPF
ncbi:hypothetical protein ACH5RR_038814 [Cinchona calisaya]|uniref:Uncharacterized protein n=1 Tax=Cinchona calisaya TaxID=153742 RepID=A0ABD2XYX4_9GENT